MEILKQGHPQCSATLESVNTLFKGTLAGIVSVAGVIPATLQFTAGVHPSVSGGLN